MQNGHFSKEFLQKITATEPEWMRKKRLEAYAHYESLTLKKKGIYFAHLHTALQEQPELLCTYFILFFSVKTPSFRAEMQTLFLLEINYQICYNNNAFGMGCALGIGILLDIETTT